jgi:hypothetical protein
VATPEERDRPAIEATPAMIEAGAECLASYLDGGAAQLRGLAAEVFREMLRVRAG